VIVAFNNGQVKHIQLKFVGEKNKIVINNYLSKEATGNSMKNMDYRIPGKVEKIVRNRNTSTQQVYLVVRKREEDGGKRVLATIEFYS
jgi:hypothetical protein